MNVAGKSKKEMVNAMKRNRQKKKKIRDHRRRGEREWGSVNGAGHKSSKEQMEKKCSFQREKEQIVTEEKGKRTTCRTMKNLR